MKNTTTAPNAAVVDPQVATAAVVDPQVTTAAVVAPQFASYGPRGVKRRSPVNDCVDDSKEKKVKLGPVVQDLGNDNNLIFYPGVMSICNDADVESLMKLLMTTPFQPALFGHTTPRRELWFYKEAYNYSNKKLVPTQPAPALVAEVRSRLVQMGLITGNPAEWGCLANLYEEGKHYIPAHSDDELSIRQGSTIIGVSFGSTRRLVLKRIKPNDCQTELTLPHGSVYLMKGPTFQQEWTHGVPKTKKVVGPRLSLTFRHMAMEEEKGKVIMLYMEQNGFPRTVLCLTNEYMNATRAAQLFIDQWLNPDANIVMYQQEFPPGQTLPTGSVGYKVDAIGPSCKECTLPCVDQEMSEPAKNLLRLLHDNWSEGKGNFTTLAENNKEALSELMAYGIPRMNPPSRSNYLDVLLLDKTGLDLQLVKCSPQQ